ncbi:ecotin [Cupriavidus sp. USMAHM13]|uniref:serine protease inhibitor ecotin n=1 Tax=Cupriavidus sp. USMAHM13 TaxID=1389192 RepID=UPI0008A702EA|nr:ecotin [Cupriavidus sp. USMAHM13]
MKSNHAIRLPRWQAWTACAVLAMASGAAAAADAASQPAAPPAPAHQVTADSIKMFPAAQAGQKRFVIALPADPSEADLRVELMIGKTLRVDCNQHWFGGSLREETVQGWGYTYYRLDEAKGPAATMRACPGQEDRDAFVQVRGDTQLLRYNSRLPLVVYVPDGFEVRYRLWRASNEVAWAAAQ